MIYPFRCDHCSTIREVYRPVSESGNPEHCDCGLPMIRVYTAPHLLIVQDTYNPGLGTQISSAGSKRSALNNLRQKGIEPVEIGDQTPKIKPPESRYNFSDREIHDITQRLEANT